MNARRLVLTAFLSLSALTASALSGAPVALAESCPNVAERVGFSAALPDCRAYEAVSEPGSDPFFNTFGDPGAENANSGGRLVGGPQGAVASVTGERMAYFSITAPPGSLTDGPYYLATRGQDGWSTENTIPRQSLDIGLACLPYMVAYTPDLSKGILANGRGQQETEGVPTYNCGHDEPLLVAGEPQGFENLFVRDNETAFYELVNDTPVGVPGNDAFFQAASSDLSHVVFDEHAELTPEAPVGDDLYEWSGGVVRLVTILPDGTPVQGSIGNTTQAHSIGTPPEAANFTHAVSADGSRVFFQADGNLYGRENADQEQSSLDGKGKCADPAEACTFEVDASQTGGAGGGGTFMWADTTGSKVFFTDESKLTSDSTATPGKPDLYEYDLETGGERLTDLTVNSSEPAEVLSVSGTSEDGSYVYFVAEGALTGQEENGHGGKAEPGTPNLYLRHEGKTTFIAALQAGQDECDWALHCLTARVSPNGMFVGFDSVDSLTGYDNTPAQPGDCLGANNVPPSCDEIFLYDAARNELSCASCDPSGISPTAPSAIGPPEQDFTLVNTPSYLQRNVLDDGRVFFATYDGLLPNDGNNASDVYEYEGGQLHLISNSTGGGSFFFDASASGSDVFFVTGQHLLPGAVATSTILYDARVNGGFPEPPGSPTACSEEDCKGAVTPVPLFAPPSSATFVGAGNPAPVTTVHKSSKQVKKKHATKKKRKKGSKDRKSSRVKRTVRLHVGGVR